MNFRRTDRRKAETQLAAALSGVPAAGYDDEVLELATYARLLAPKQDLGSSAAAKQAGLDRFLREAFVASAHSVDFGATSAADGVDEVHTKDVSTEDGGTLRIVDVEPISDSDASSVLARISAKLGKPIRR